MKKKQITILCISLFLIAIFSLTSYAAECIDPDAGENETFNKTSIDGIADYCLSEPSDLLPHTLIEQTCFNDERNESEVTCGAPPGSSVCFDGACLNTKTIVDPSSDQFTFISLKEFLEDVDISQREIVYSFQGVDFNQDSIITKSESAHKLEDAHKISLTIEMKPINFFDKTKEAKNLIEFSGYNQRCNVFEKETNTTAGPTPTTRFSTVFSDTKWTHTEGQYMYDIQILLSKGERGESAKFDSNKVQEYNAIIDTYLEKYPSVYACENQCMFLTSNFKDWTNFTVKEFMRAPFGNESNGIPSTIPIPDKITAAVKDPTGIWMIDTKNDAYFFSLGTLSFQKSSSSGNYNTRLSNYFPIDSILQVKGLIDLFITSSKNKLHSFPSFQNNPDPEDLRLVTGLPGYPFNEIDAMTDFNGSYVLIKGNQFFTISSSDFTAGPSGTLPAPPGYGSFEPDAVTYLPQQDQQMLFFAECDPSVSLSRAASEKFDIGNAPPALRAAVPRSDEEVSFE